MSQRPACHHEVGFLKLAVVISSGLLIEPPSKLSRHGKSPGQILVAVFPVTTTFAFAVTGPLGANFSTIGSIVADLGEPVDWTAFQLDGKRSQGGAATESLKI